MRPEQLQKVGQIADMSLKGDSFAADDRFNPLTVILSSLPQGRN